MASDNDSSKNKKSAPSSGGYYYYDEGSSYYYSEGGGGGQPQRGIKDYLLILRERIWYVLIGFILVFSLAIVITINQTQIYRAGASVQVLRQEARPISVTGPTGQEVEIRSAEDFNTQVQLLQSVSMAQRVADRFTAEERAKFMAPYEKGGVGDPLTPMEVLMRNREIAPLRMSLVVAVRYSHPDPQIAAMVANYFAEEYIDNNLRVRIEESMRMVEELQDRAEQQRRKVEEIELRLQDFRERTGLVSLDKGSDIVTDRLRSLNQMAADRERVFSEVETQYLTMRRIQEQGGRLTDFQAISSQPMVTDLLTQRANQRITVEQLSERYRHKHPRMIQAQAAVQQTEQELAEAVKSAVEKIATSYESAKRNLDEVNRSLKEQEDELLRLTRLGVEYENIERESLVNQQIYSYLIGRMRDTTISSTIETPSARIVDRAMPPQRAVVPNIPLNLAIGFLGGLGLGFGVAFFVAFIDDRVKTAFDIENVLGLTLLGIIPEIKKLNIQEKARVVSSEADKQVVEAFRTLHSSLKLNNESKFAQAILVTSSLPGEGKTFVSDNLAQTFAAHGEKTLLVDCDLRMPNVHKSLEVENKKGLIDVCMEDVPLEEAVQSTVLPSLDVLTTGGRAKNPTQILSGKNFDRFISEARKQYDRIIFDTPPLAAVSDALILLPMVDGALFTIKFNKVKRSAAKHNARRLVESNVPVFGAVLNNISLSISGYYYAQYYDKSYYDYYAPTSKRAKEAEEELR